MALHPLAGKPAPRELLINVPRLVSAYYSIHPDPNNPTQRVAFGTSGHRGTPSEGSLNEDHILAVCQAVCELRQAQGIRGPLYLGMDTHALSEPAHISAIEVFAANGVDLVIQAGQQQGTAGGYTPTPVISRAILIYNRAHPGIQADGIVITPSHNPPSDGGIKYNPPAAGPADTSTTKLIQERANEIILAGYGHDGLRAVKRMPYKRALQAENVHAVDYMLPYVTDLENVVDMQAVAAGKLKIGVDPLGGAAVYYWDVIAERYGLNLEVVNCDVDPTFRFMNVDHDGKIRMDCSSPYAMAGLIGLKERFDIAFGNDPDVDRHGIVTPSAGLLDPNHYLAVAIQYLFTHRPGWLVNSGIGKTLVSSSMIDRVAADLGRKLYETPVGFKWFVDGLLDGTYGFGGEESAGASFLRKDGTVWTTDKDGIILNLLAAEITAVTGRDPGQHYQALTERFGNFYYVRVDAPANAAQKAVLTNLSPEQVQATELAGYPITARFTRAPGNNAPVGGLKVVTDAGWFAARPSGTEEIYKLYAESFIGADHLNTLLDGARELVSAAFEKAEV